jgi:DnaK suppressor protein
MAHSRKSAPSRPKAKKAASMTKGAPKAAPKAAAKHAPAVKPVAKSTVVKSVAKVAPKVAPKAGAKPLPVKAGAKGTLKPKIKPKNMPRPPAVVHPIGVLPPESISRVAQKPARPLPMTPRPAAKPRPAVVDTSDQGVTADDYPEFQQRLLEARVRVLKEMGHYENTVLKVNQRDSAGDLSGYSFHMADVGTDAMEREKAFQLASAEGRILLEINEALRRIARSEYGRCESCENPILRARLEAMPVARLCLSCKEKEERAARGMS